MHACRAHIHFINICNVASIIVRVGPLPQGSSSGLVRGIVGLSFFAGPELGPCGCRLQQEVELGSEYFCCPNTMLTYSCCVWCLAICSLVCNHLNKTAKGLFKSVSTNREGCLSTCMLT